MSELRRLTVAERTEQARKRVCPRCRQGVGYPCRGRSTIYAGQTWPGSPMKGIHAERLALIPKEVQQ